MIFSKNEEEQVKPTSVQGSKILLLPGLYHQGYHLLKFYARIGAFEYSKKQQKECSPSIAANTTYQKISSVARECARKEFEIPNKAEPVTSET
jgi:hypothetical protein